MPSKAEKVQHLKSFAKPKIKRVVVIQRLLASYRLPFFEKLEEKLAESNVELCILFGQPGKKESFECPSALHCGHEVRNRYLYLGKRFLVWQPVLELVKDADLIITEHAASNLTNIVLFFLKKFTRKKLAFWGHGRCFFPNRSNRLAEWIKKKYATQADFWFAYNDLSSQVLVKMGVPEGKVVSCNNAIDTTENMRFLGDITEEKQQDIRQKYKISATAPVGLVCSRLNASKRLEFLLSTLQLIREKIDDFHFFVVGDGPQSGLIRNFEKENQQWFHWVGARYGKDKAEIFSISDVFMLPGHVGLHIVESFSFLVPLVTLNSYHPPEIAYLKNGVNGLIVEGNETSYALAVISLLKDRKALARLVEGCDSAREQLTIEAMVDRFAKGVVCALDA